MMGSFKVWLAGTLLFGFITAGFLVDAQAASIDPPISGGVSANPPAPINPVTAGGGTVVRAGTAGKSVFIESLATGRGDQLVGVYSEGVLALPVVQQPVDDPGWISTQPGEVTQFSMPYTLSGNIGLLAHNYLAGEAFTRLGSGQRISLVYGDGSTRDYQVVSLLQYQALNPESVTSDFVDLSTAQRLSPADLFAKVYSGDHHLTLQTCIQRGDVNEWGRLFVIAWPY